MSNSSQSGNFSLSVLQVTEFGPASYSLETAARLVDLHPQMLRHYCRLGLLGEFRTNPGIELKFDDNDLYQLRCFERYRLTHRVNRKTLKLIGDLSREIERLQKELRFFRDS